MFFINFKEDFSMPSKDELLRVLFERFQRKKGEQIPQQITKPAEIQPVIASPIVVFEATKGEKEKRLEDKRLGVIERIFTEAKNKRSFIKFEPLDQRLKRQKIKIRFAQNRDAESLLKLYTQSTTKNHIAGVKIPEGEDEKKAELNKIRSFIKSKSNYVLIAADENGKILGTGTAQVQTSPLNRVVAARMAVDESERGRGIAESLTRTIHSIAFLRKEKGGLDMDTVMAGVFISESEKHHEKLGEGCERPIRLFAKLHYTNPNVILKRAAFVWSSKLKKHVPKDVVQFSLSTEAGHWPGEAGSEKVVRALFEGIKSYKRMQAPKEKGGEIAKGKR